MNHVIDMEPEECSLAEKHHPSRQWAVDVDVYLNAVGPGNVADFEVVTCLPVENSAPDPHGRIVFRNNGRPGFTINFRLFDNTNDGNGSGYVFPDPPGPKRVGNHQKWAMWSRIGEGCPPADYADQWEEFTSTDVLDEGATLVVRNLNNTSTLFGYTLRVTNDEGQTFVNLDPGGNNMNGSQRF
jgi:hypothetical protein